MYGMEVPRQELGKSLSTNFGQSLIASACVAVKNNVEVDNDINFRLYNYLADTYFRSFHCAGQNFWT